jgi:hypothetical protein
MGGARCAYFAFPSVGSATPLLTHPRSLSSATIASPRASDILIRGFEPFSKKIAMKSAKKTNLSRVKWNFSSTFWLFQSKLLAAFGVAGARFKVRQPKRKRRNGISNFFSSQPVEN